MSISPFKTFIPGEILTASDLNSSLLEIINNPIDLWSPAGKTVDFNGQLMILDSDADTSMQATVDDRLDWTLAGQLLHRWDATVVSPVNGFDIIFSATGDPVVTARAVGTDVNVSLQEEIKGAAKKITKLVGGANNLFEQDATVALPVNGISQKAAATGGAVEIVPIGADADIGLNINSKGTDPILLNGVDVSTLGGDGFASGTRMLFNQNSAPTNWTIDATKLDSMIRTDTTDVVTVAGVAFDTMFAATKATTSVATGATVDNASATGTIVVDSHVLTTGEIPSHFHENGIGFEVSDLVATYTTSLTLGAPTADSMNHGTNNGTEGIQTTATGGGGGHVHTGSFTPVVHLHVLTDPTHSHTLDLDAKSDGVVIASKD